MRARDWLVKQGLAQKGRGRMSKLAKEALETAMAAGTIFSDYSKSDTDGSSGLVKVRVQAAPLQKLEKQREEKVIWAHDQSKYWIAFDTCNGCGRPITFCTHEIPKLPHWVNSEVYWEKVA
jgi:hypothetical protein